jgi:hypothetical protein
MGKMIVKQWESVWRWGLGMRMNIIPLGGSLFNTAELAHMNGGSS